MSLQNSSVSDFTSQLASKTSVPGGGGASALVAAIGIALGDMVGEFTIGKKKYADVEDEIKGLMEKAEEIRMALLKCIDDDAVAFEPLSKAYGIPKEDPTRDEIMEKCLKDAAKVPFTIMELACQAIELQRQFADKGSVIMISDAATGVALLEGALKGAAVNVKINTKSMNDRAYAQNIDSKVNSMLESYLPMAQKIYKDVWNRL
ncbi:cyclodeaminase/cyclohydrolase family protein [Pseudobutyrivibrio xylanivorans]|uniref:Cyclodeaminase/cyclohydrolase family protein n=1 Tax=Pseudobutyrivibrio xylanivorans TaxID=185007 RepID=A0A5P6VRT8_PSEXY|nr:cyclodeaminase/cyclohydrolase family protein [Pseudobutyrivibrio xylanivorans]QFJ55415.1 cyclodeaminase/cyclohydrolase family protein [Pseudobutyrivibrio xylanivorans]